MATTDRQKIIKQLYNDKVKDRLFEIVEWKREGYSNANIAERLEVHPVEFHEMVEAEITLQNVLKKAEDMIVDMLESKMVMVAKKGNVTAMKEVLAKLAPEKWGNNTDGNQTLQTPTIELKIGDATIEDEYLQSLVEDLEKQINNRTNGDA